MSDGRYKAYPKYKDSGVEWIGQLPNEWEVVRIKFCASLNSSKTELDHLTGETEVTFLPMEAIGEQGELDTTRTKMLSEVSSGYTYLAEGDVCIAKITPCFENGKGAILRGLTNGVAFATTEVVPLRCHAENSPEFLYYLLTSAPFNKQAEGSMYGAGGQKRVADNFVANYHFAKPPLPEQIQIAKFLDHETAKIDGLIEKQEELIRLLKEKRQAVISQAVTKGLNPHAPLKDSGIEWLGQVPTHWIPLQFKYLIREIDQGKSPECEARLASLDEWGVLKSGCVNRGIFCEEEHKALPSNIPPTPTAEVKEGDLLMSRASGSTDLIGSVGLVGNVRPRLMMSDKIFRLLPESTALPKFIWRMAASTPVRKQIELSINGAEGLANNITKDSIGRLLVTCPPLAEQQAIVDHLELRCAQIDRLVSNVERQITLLQERRTALISAAVTGKIKIN